MYCQLALSAVNHRVKLVALYDQMETTLKPGSELKVKDWLFHFETHRKWSCQLNAVTSSLNQSRSSCFQFVAAAQQHAWTLELSPHTATYKINR